MEARIADANNSLADFLGESAERVCAKPFGRGWLIAGNATANHLIIYGK
jgi:hypothetical protein